jgi:hypothetical protein
MTSFQGLNHFDSRYADGGNQFSNEPPDQGLCVGNGYVMETVNSVVQVYNQAGTALINGNPGSGTGPVGLSLNQLYGYPSWFDRTNNVFGPSLFDVSCTYDQASHRWFHLADNLAEDINTGNYTGQGSLDLLVSQTSNPLGAWNLYSIDTVNDGTGGTPNHACDLGPCFADYPHLAADANGIYITTNEYSFFGSNYNGSQLYALSKADLVAGVSSPKTVYFENLTVPSLGQKAFTVLAAQSALGSFVTSYGGVEYFLSSTAGDGSETGNTTGGSNKIVVWALSNTHSFNGPSPDPTLDQTVVRTNTYVLPPLGLQKNGRTPLLSCINIGAACFGPKPFFQKGPYPIDSSDTRMMTSFLDHGTLWGAVDTAIVGSGGSSYDPSNNYAPTPVGQKSGVLYFAIRPSMHDGLHAEVSKQGYLAVDNGNLSYPSIATVNGVGFVGMSLVGPTRYPSAVYTKIGLGMSASSVRVSAAGVGPDDGFTGTYVGGNRPRWGDYGYASVSSDGTVWFASEYIAQSCGFSTWIADSTCGGTRSFYANWATRISQLNP